MLVCKVRDMGEKQGAERPAIGFSEYVALLVVVGILALAVLIVLGPAIAHLLARLFPHLFAT